MYRYPDAGLTNDQSDNHLLLNWMTVLWSLAKAISVARLYRGTIALLWIAVI